MKPRHDPLPKVTAGHPPTLLARLAARALRRRKGDDAAGNAPCPVTPDRPLNLSGGAAAALEFDD